MKNIIIWGIDNSAQKLYNMLDFEKVKLIGFASNDKIGEKFFEYDIMGPEGVMKIIEKVDHIVITSINYHNILEQLLKLGISEKKIITSNFEKGIVNGLVEMHYFKSQLLKDEIEKIKKLTFYPDNIVTGISYHNTGIDKTKLSLNGQDGLKFAWASQDLFYSYKIVEYLYNNFPQQMGKLKYCIIGLEYYGMEFDFSRTGSALGILRYYPYIKDTHNLIEKKYVDKLYEYVNNLFEKYDVIYNLIRKDRFWTAGGGAINMKEEGEKRAHADSDKNYPVTVLENQCILNDFINLLKINNALPIIVIMPVTKFYSDAYPIDKIKKFYFDLNEILNKNSALVLDYFNKCNYPAECWADVSHLNAKGAQIFTEMLKNDIDKKEAIIEEKFI